MAPFARILSVPSGSVASYVAGMQDPRTGEADRLEPRQELFERLAGFSAATTKMLEFWAAVASLRRRQEGQSG